MSKPAVKSPPPVVSEPYYFGAHKKVGHYAWNRSLFMLVWENPAGAWLRDHDGVLPPQGNQHQGLIRFRKWAEGGARCVVAFWDRSVDSRAGSHSTFLLPGDLTPSEALAAAREAFPDVFARFQFEIQLPPTPPDQETT